MAVTLTADRSVLLLVHLQQRLMPAIAGGGAVVANVRRLAEAARLLGVPVVATEQNPAGLGGTIPALAPLPTRKLEKRFFDATREADFESFLPAAGRRSSSPAARLMSASCRPCSGFSTAAAPSASLPTPSAREARRTATRRSPARRATAPSS
jgi:hypothetical protein